MSFKPGDVVQFKSGGPRMTVSVIRELWESNLGGHISCRWFNPDNTIDMAYFVDAELCLAENNSEKTADVAVPVVSSVAQRAQPGVVEPRCPCSHLMKNHHDGICLEQGCIDDCITSVPGGVTALVEQTEAVDDRGESGDSRHE